MLLQSIGAILYSGTVHLLSYANFTTSCVATLCFVYKHSLSIYVNICVTSVCSSVANFDAVPLFDAYWHTVAVYLVRAVICSTSFWCCWHVVLLSITWWHRKSFPFYDAVYHTSSEESSLLRLHNQCHYFYFSTTASHFSF